MQLECEKCGNSVNSEEIEFEVIKEGGEIEEDNWYLDAEFETTEDEATLPLKVEKMSIYCPEHSTH